MTDLEKIKPLIRSVLLSEPEGVPLHRLRKDYEEVTMEPLPYKNLGFHTVEDMCRSLTDVVRIQQNGGVNMLYAVSHESTKHVEKLIANQKKKKKPPVHSLGFHGSYHFNPHTSHHRISHSSRNPHFKASSPPVHAPPQINQPSNQLRQATVAHRLQRTAVSEFPIRSFTSFQTAPDNISKPARSVWDRLGKSPQIDNSSFSKGKTNYFRSDVPRRVSNSDEITTVKSLPLVPPEEKGKWIVPKNSAPYRHQYSESRTYSIPDLITLARPGESVQVEGYFLGEIFRSASRTLRSGRKLNTEMIKFPLHRSNATSSQSITCIFSFPNWGIATYTFPNELVEGSKLKIIGEHQKDASDSKQHNVSVQYLELFQPIPTSPTNEPEVSIQLKMSSLAIDTPATQPQEVTETTREVNSTLSNYSSEASDTSVYTDSDKNTTEGEESPDQGYSSPIPTPSSDFPPASSLNLFNLPKKFFSRFRTIKNLRHFYLSTINDSNDQSPLGNLTSTLTSYHQSLNQPTPLIPPECKDLFCSAFHQDSSTWQRAKFLESSSPSFSHFSILFIDLGEEAKLPPSCIRSFPVQFLQLRPQAILCSLDLPYDLISDQHLISIFRKLVSQGPLKIRLIDIVDGKYEVDITTASDANVVSEIMFAAKNRNSQSSTRSRSSTNPSSISSQLSFPDNTRSGNGFNNEVFSPVLNTPTYSNPPPRPQIKHVPPVPSLPPRLHISTAIPSPQIPPSPLFSQMFQFPPKSHSYTQGALANGSPSKLPDELNKLVTYEPLHAFGSRNVFPVKITSIISPDKFYIQNYDKKQELADLTSSINFYCKANKREQPWFPVMEFCLAEFSPDEWARVQVISWDQTKMEARVFLLDYGYIKVVPMKKLLKMTANHLKLPFQAISVNLNGVSPVGNSWSETSLAYFQSLTLDKVMWACHKHTNSILLIITGDGPDICIHEMLISRDLAQASN